MAPTPTELRLTAALESIANSACCSGCQEAALVAKAALLEVPTQAPDDVLDIYVPGAWSCPKCQFHLSKATIFVATGQIGSSRDDVMRMTGELCPNDGEPMVRETWRDRAESNRQWGESLMNDIIAATRAEHLPGALETIKQWAERS